MDLERTHINLQDKFSEIPHVRDVLWYHDVADLSLPVEIISKKDSAGSLFPRRCNHDAGIRLTTPLPPMKAMEAVTHNEKSGG